MAVHQRTEFSCYGIKLDGCRGIIGQQRAMAGNRVRRAAWPESCEQRGLASPSLTQSCACTQWKQLIPLFYGEEGEGGLKANNKALSLKMSCRETVRLGGDTVVKSQGTKRVWKIV